MGRARSLGSPLSASKLANKARMHDEEAYLAARPTPTPQDTTQPWAL